MSKTPGLIHVYTGDGKGKTTAALGLAFRAAGHGRRTYVGQFMKGRDYGELKTARMLGDLLTIEQFGKPSFIHVSADGTHSTATQQDIDMARQGLESVRLAMLGGQYDMVILDEINVALYFKLIDLQQVLDLLDSKPDRVELVLTGRRVPQPLIDRADYVTIMQEIKHPYQQGIQARKGVEY